ncbi:MAG: small basic protein [Candidatus Omnitrophota bacterium]|jgi:small basic protein (TIGR04137 family)
MSIHPSLTISEQDKKPRSVLKRSERIRQMMDKGKWKDGDSIYNLPKIKSLKIKIKKEKVEKAADATTAAAGATAAPAAGTKDKAAPKAQEKK